MKTSLTEVSKGSSVFKDFQNVELGPFPEYFGKQNFRFFVQKSEMIINIVVKPIFSSHTSVKDIKSVAQKHNFHGPVV